MKALNLLLLLLFSTLLNTAFSFSPPSLIVTQLRPSLIISVKNRGASSTWKRQSCNRQRHGHAPLLWVTENGNKQDESLQDASFYIRKALYADLKDVADIIVESFYSSDFAKSPWRHLYRLAELDRLQQNFPYSDERHSVFVAVATETKQVIAFVDVDARPATRKRDAPRPYLSDLCISSAWRRRGIATSLVRTCERTVCHDMKRRELYIRVEQANHAAIQMYKNLHYQQQDHDYFGVEDTTMLLHKSLKRNDKESTSTAVEVKDTVGEEMCLGPN